MMFGGDGSVGQLWGWKIPSAAAWVRWVCVGRKGSKFRTVTGSLQDTQWVVFPPITIKPSGYKWAESFWVTGTL